MFNKGEIVHHTRDALGSILVVDYRKHRVLTFNSVFEQSKIDRRYPYLPVHEYNRAMMLPAVFANPGHVTILGLGGGVMAGAFHHLYPECRIHAVELRQAVLDTAREFFDLPDSERLEVTRFMPGCSRSVPMTTTISGMPWKSWRTQAPIWFSLTCITQTG
jgi:spermidine synthase